MPLIDMAEAISRGDIIVDEVDALNKYAERFIGDDRSRHTQRLPNLPIPSAVTDSESGNLQNDRFSWNQVLVDEVDLIRAAEHARSNEGVSVLVPSNGAGPAPNNNFVADTGDGVTWDRSLLVDEVDFIKAVEHGEISSDNSHIMRLSYENRIRRDEVNAEEGQNDVELSSLESDNDPASSA